MRLRFKCFAVFACVVQLAAAQTKPDKALDMYFIDTEGGLSALYVSPTGESLLIDTGNPGRRDTDRIMETLNSAGVKQIDHLILTHYHVDHIGGLQELAKRIPIKHFIDHGPSIEPREQVQGFQAMYAELYSKVKHTVVKPGDKIPFAGADLLVITSAEQSIKKPISGAPGAGKPNPTCADFKPRDEARVDPDNHQSVGVVISLGKFRTVNMGDFTYNREKELMCPNNPVGTVDLYLTAHHGIDQSGSRALVHGLHPRVAVMHNSTRKGGAIATMQTLYSSPGLEDIWQLHWAYAAGIDYNTPALFIANPEEIPTLANVLLNPPPTFGQGPGRGAPAPPAAGAPVAGVATGPPTAAAKPSAAVPPGGRGFGAGGHDGPAFLIKVSALADGSFTVTNTRNNFSKTYAASK